MFLHGFALNPVTLLCIPRILLHHHLPFVFNPEAPTMAGVLRWVIRWAIVQGDDDEVDFVRRRDSAIGSQWQTDMSKPGGNAGVNALGWGGRMTSGPARMSNPVYSETYSCWQWAWEKVWFIRWGFRITLSYSNTEILHLIFILL